MTSNVSILSKSNQKRRVGRLLSVAVAHFVVFVWVFLSSLNFNLEGEPGYDAVAARSDFCAHYLVPVLGFPVFWISEIRPLRWVFDGVMGLLWFFANSVLWAWVICLIIDTLNRRRA